MIHYYNYGKGAVVALFLSTLSLHVGSLDAFVLPHGTSHKVPMATTTLMSSTVSSSTAVDKTMLEQVGLSVPPISPFGQDTTPTSHDKALLGGKGANLAQMSAIGLAVPPGFTLTTECCQQYCADWKQSLPDMVWEQVLIHVKQVEQAMKCEFGQPTNPLLLSVRSGAAISMPGMMDTVLNLGMNTAVCEGLAKQTQNARFAWDSYRRFLEMFGNVVLEIPRSHFEEQMDMVKYEKNILQDSELDVDDLKEIVKRFQQVYVDNDQIFPQDVYEQLKLAIGAVFRGWMGDRAVTYRQVENIRGLLGTAVNVQAMVFGNMGETSGTGVCFTRNPNTGERTLFGEYLLNAQGEDVVAGIRTPHPIADLAESMPEVYAELKANTDLLEKHYADMQDIEFTIQQGKLYMLQTRSGKRVGAAAVKIAVDGVAEGLMDTATAVTRVKPEHLDQLLHPGFPDSQSDEYQSAVIAHGLPASPGAAVGRLAFTNEQVLANQAAGIPSILTRDETSPDDVEGMYAATGILTARGGMTSHAAVVCRGWGVPCVCGCAAIHVDEAQGVLTVTLSDGSQQVFHQGDFISLNGSTGEVLAGEQAVAPPTMSGDLETFMGWVDEHRTLGVLANADTPSDAATARQNGATGIGLCRSEHMFFAPERIAQVRKLILGNAQQEAEALKELLAFQREDYQGIFKAMDGLPVTIRLLDPPLHEFLPSIEDEEILSSLAADLDTTVEDLRDQVEAMTEVNPMLGLRGCRLGITRPAIIEMQVRAILEGALRAMEESNVDARPDIMIPLVGTAAEFRHQSALVRRVADEVFAEHSGKTCPFRVGTMIEIPRAALTASEIAEEADFFSFGSNDLTQMTFGYSRDDVGTFVPQYLQNGILPDDPFVTIDTVGVGQLIQRAVEQGRAVKPELKIGVCGEHGGDPRSVHFFDATGLDYVSCSPLRVPIARLAAAQAAVEAAQKKQEGALKP